MPKLTIPLVQAPNPRGLNLATLDGFVSGAFHTVVPDSLTGRKTIYLQKRPGFTASSVGSAVGVACFKSPSANKNITAFGVPSTVYKDSTSQGALTDGSGNSYTAMHITETIISDLTYWLISATRSSGTISSGWYLPSDADSQTAYTGDTHSNTTIDNIASTSGMYAGQAITGSGIPANTKIATVTSATAITITNAATATAAGVSLTKTPIAQILSSNFPTTAVGAFVSLNGRSFIMTTSGRIYQSGLNDVTTWAADGYVPTDLISDNGVGLALSRNRIIALSSLGAEVLQNVGNPSGSVLVSDQAQAFAGGARRGSSGRYTSCIAFDGYRAAWISVDGGNLACVRLLDDNGVRIVSTEPINRVIRGSTLSPSISLFGAYGQSFVHVGGDSVPLNLIYSIDNDEWLDLGFSTKLIMSGGARPDAVTSAVIAVSATATDGLVYTLDESVFQDNGSNYAWTVTTENYSINSGEPFIITHIDLISDSQSSGSATLSISEDDYANFLPLGDFDLTQAIKRIDGCGQFPSMVSFKLTETANRGFRGQALVVYWQPCGRPN